MKKLTIILIAFLLTISFSELKAQIRIGAKVGLNIANMKIEDFDDSKSKLGIQIGAVGDYEIMDALYAQAGLIISQKGYKYEDGESFGGGDSWSREDKTSLTYLDIPLTAIYKLELGDLSVYGQGGFNIGLGLSGKYKSEYSETIDGVTDSESDTETIEWGSGNDAFAKRMELGFIIGAGVEINESIQVGLSYNLGLNNIAAQSGADYKNRVFAITATYFFSEL